MTLRIHISLVRLNMVKEARPNNPMPRDEYREAREQTK